MLSPDEKLLSISTLDQSIVTYPFSNSGPVLDRARESFVFEPTESSPILPIIHTAGNLILSGTPTGDVPVVRPDTMRLPSIHQGMCTSCCTRQCLTLYPVIVQVSAILSGRLR